MSQTAVKYKGKSVLDKASKKNGISSKKGIWTYFEEIKSEFRKISWTDREELLTYTKIVVGATLIFGMAIYLADVVIQNSLAGLNSVIQWIAG